jgi:hypothetical protein
VDADVIRGLLIGRTVFSWYCKEGWHAEWQCWLRWLAAYRLCTELDTSLQTKILTVTKSNVRFVKKHLCRNTYAQTLMHKHLCTNTYAQTLMHKYLCTNTYAQTLTHKHFPSALPMQKVFFGGWGKERCFIAIAVKFLSFYDTPRGMSKEIQEGPKVNGAH